MWNVKIHFRSVFPWIFSLNYTFLTPCASRVLVSGSGPSQNPHSRMRGLALEIKLKCRFFFFFSPPTIGHAWTLAHSWSKNLRKIKIELWGTKMPAAIWDRGITPTLVSSLSKILWWNTLEALFDYSDFPHPLIDDGTSYISLTLALPNRALSVMEANLGPGSMHACP